MELGNRLKALRARDGMSQETLAERIYVTRQTVGNWECGRSYPDLQSLMMLSALFNVSIDELVKGDLEIMNNELDRFKYKLWFVVIIVCMILSAATFNLLIETFHWYGLIIPIVLEIIFLGASVALYRITMKHRLGTYKEIMAFLKNEERPLTEKPSWMTWIEEHTKAFVIIIVACALGVAAIGFISGYIYQHFLVP